MKINEVWPDWLMGKGVMSALTQNGNCPWTRDPEITPGSLDLLYHGHSGLKETSPLLDALMIDNVLTKDMERQVSKAILANCLLNWNKLWDTRNLVYNPIENYSMTEEELKEPNLTDKNVSDSTHTDKDLTTRTPNLTEETIRTPELTKTGTSTNTPNTIETTSDVRTPQLTTTTTDKGKDTTDTSIYGADSSVPSPSEKVVVDKDNTNTVNEVGTDTTDITTTKEGTDKTETSETESGSETTNNTKGGNETVDSNRSITDHNETTETHSGNEKRTLTRSGNIGVTTSQQMLQSERDLWNWQFFDKVFSDIDNILTIPIY